ELRPTQVSKILKARFEGRHSGVDGSGVSVIVCIPGDHCSRLACLLAGGLIESDAEDIGRRVVGDVNSGDVEARDLDDWGDVRRDRGMNHIWVVWKDDNAWHLASGKIDWDVSREVDGQELSMIQLFHGHGGALGGLRTTSTAAPRSNN